MAISHQQLDAVRSAASKSTGRSFVATIAAGNLDRIHLNEIQRAQPNSPALLIALKAAAESALGCNFNAREFRDGSFELEMRAREK